MTNIPFAPFFDTLQRMSKPSSPPPSSNDSKCPIEPVDCSILEELEALRLENEELKQALHTDMLTGLYNYRHLLDALESEMERTRRTRMPTSLIMLDLDHFKQVNDTWGHEIGNLVLIKVAEVIRTTLRKMDVACRYGGEEFTIILPNTHLPQAVNVAERLRSNIQNNPLVTGEETIPLSASFGVELYRPEMTLSADELIHLTDGYLYQAKQNGRNQVAHPAWPESTQVSADEKAALVSPSPMQSEKD
jgi:diguanylate cyclase (GGDEF)-like protein